jgi:transposase
VVRRSPLLWGYAQTRWTLRRLREVCSWLRLRTDAGLGQLRRRLKITWQRGRSYIHSPDPDYEAKWAAVQAVRAVVSGPDPAPDQVVVYLDEHGVGRQPTLAPTWAASPDDAPHAPRSTKADTIVLRLLGSLDHQTGRVLYHRGSHITVSTQVAFYQRLAAAYPQATRIWVVLDNWPVHHHPDLLVALEPQETPWLLPLPPSWPTEPSPQARARWGHLHLPIQLVPLPTYASWLNPIEKLWRWLNADIVHLHPHADDLPTLRERIDGFLDQFAAGSTDLLRYVGLQPHGSPPN